MKILKWLFYSLGIVVCIITILFAVSVYNIPKPDDLIKFNTYNHHFTVPYRFVVPGTLPGQPPVKGYDTEGPDIFIWFEGKYVQKFVPTFKLKGGKDDRYFRNVHVTLSDGTDGDIAHLWSWKKGFDPITLSGDFENGYVEHLGKLGLYRVFREYHGEKLGGFWDLVTVEPSISNKPGSSYKGLRVGSCHLNADNVETSCYFFTDIMGMYADISASEDDYERLDEIKKMVVTHLQDWEVSAM